MNTRNESSPFLAQEISTKKNGEQLKFLEENGTSSNTKKINMETPTLQEVFG